MKETKRNFASFFQELRKSKRVTLRAFCITANADPGNISRMERNAIPPPQDHGILSRYASALDLKEGSDDWYLFFDLAAADRGMVPKDIMDNDALVRELPAFFRTLRGQKPTETELKKVVGKIRNS
jgi:transcriptional regulator with XRE-family HTH domain